MKLLSYGIGAVIVVLVVGVVAWYAQRINQTITGESSSGSQAGLGLTATVTLGTSGTLGSYLTAGASGMTLYTSTNDRSGVSNCTGTCATKWFPYLVSTADNIIAGAGVTGTLGTITRSNGTLQVTYNGMPLYFWSQDTKPGDTTGEGNGNIWNVARP
jgi:predicted lipoprotein with Yx(FWY)xxD motif